MPLPFGSADDRPKQTLVESKPVEPINPTRAIEKSAPVSMDWEERLRTTEGLLQELSGGYPFAWNGDGPRIIGRRQP